MSLAERVSNLEEQTNNPIEQETIIPKFQNPDTCVFCTNKDYDSIFYMVYRAAYHQKTGKDFEKQYKENCIHHNDEWLKHSLRSARFTWSTIMDGKKSMTSSKIIDILENKEEREKILTKEYNEIKNYSCAIDLYLPKSSNTDTKGRYNGSFTIEDDIPIQNKIVQNKIKIYYTNAIEALRTLDDEETQ